MSEEAEKRLQSVLAKLFHPPKSKPNSPRLAFLFLLLSVCRENLGKEIDIQNSWTCLVRKWENRNLRAAGDVIQMGFSFLPITKTRKIAVFFYFVCSFVSLANNQRLNLSFSYFSLVFESWLGFFAIWIEFIAYGVKIFIISICLILIKANPNVFLALVWLYRKGKGRRKNSICLNHIRKVDQNSKNALLRILWRKIFHFLSIFLGFLSSYTEFNTIFFLNSHCSTDVLVL